MAKAPRSTVRPAPGKRMPAGERREVLLLNAKRLFAKQGYAATSIDDIAAAAGVTKPVVYDHFASKRALYFAVMRRLRDELMDQAARALAADASPRQRLRVAIERYFLQVKRDPAIIELLFVQPRHEPELMQEWERLQAEAIGQLKPLARALAPRLLPWQLNVAVHLLHHGLNAMAQAWPRNISAADMADLVMTLQWRGLEAFD